MKRVLIISYYWPPAGGISVIRPLKLAKYISEFGWDPIVCTAENPHFPFEDENAAKDIPKNLEVLKVPIVEPYEIYKKLTGQKQKSALADVIQNAPKRSFLHNLSVWIRGNFFIPDARCLWIKPVVNELTKYLKENPVDAIITTGPPHSVNRIGYLLNKKLQIPWLADFQDPWTQVDYYKHFKICKWAHRRHRKMENQIFDNADLITIVSNSWKTDLESIGASNVEVVPLGYDTT
ncbi:MAG: glycosyltransferase, partial [Flavobacteriales bacterium]